MLQDKVKTAQVCEVEIVYSNPHLFQNRIVKSSKDIYEFLKDIYDPRKVDYKEFFFVVLLNRRNEIIGYSNISIGSTSGCVVNIKEIFQLALKTNASSIILSHNHPSGNLTPSTQDKELTRKINQGCNLLEIQLLDHIIISSEGYYSFADNIGFS